MKKRVYLIGAILYLTSFLVYSEDRNFKFDSYENAELASNFIFFGMSSTKLGLISSSFKGYVREFKVSFNYNKGNQKLEGVSTSFAVKSLDTDIDARNEKMWDFCLGEKESPTITVKILSPIDLSETEKEYDAEMMIRGKNKKIKVQISAKMLGKGFEVAGRSKVSLKNLEIPDPSIVIASVNDEIEIQFKSML